MSACRGPFDNPAGDQSLGQFGIHHSRQHVGRNDREEAGLTQRRYLVDQVGRVKIVIDGFNIAFRLRRVYFEAKSSGQAPGMKGNLPPEITPISPARATARARRQLDTPIPMPP